MQVAGEALPFPGAARSISSHSSAAFFFFKSGRDAQGASPIQPPDGTLSMGTHNDAGGVESKGALRPSVSCTRVSRVPNERMRQTKEVT